MTHVDGSHFPDTSQMLDLKLGTGVKGSAWIAATLTCLSRNCATTANLTSPWHLISVFPCPLEPPCLAPTLHLWGESDTQSQEEGEVTEDAHTAHIQSPGLWQLASLQRRPHHL